MQKINVLSKNISELIAAGEVIERPASIVKELLENSIDALSTAITVEIRRGGISYIRITDNGTGMEKEDAAVSFLRHATSKIHEEIDLDNITSLGFRGEALASIAAVSKVELTTKPQGASYGTRVTLEGGENISVEEAGCPTGTTIIVRDLFYNVPARLKFLKRDASEGNSIAGIIDKIALSHPEISFKLINDNKIKIHTPGSGDLLSAIHAVFGKEFATSLIPCEYDFNGIAVSGFVSKTAASRTNRSMQHFFVNARYVRSKTCLVALEEGYKNSIMVGRYPLCVMNINMPANSVDVNVHPAKIEVRFINERIIFDAIYFAVKSALASEDVLKNTAEKLGATKIENMLSTFKSDDSEQTELTKAPVKSFIDDEPEIKITTQNIQTGKTLETPYSYREETSGINKKTKIASDNAEYNRSEPMQEDEFSYIVPKNLVRNNENITLNVDMRTGEVIEPQCQSNTAVEIPQKAEPKLIPLNVKVIGELFKTYVLFEVEDNFLMLDKHAAHERIIFERLKERIKTEDKQILLKPVVTAVSNDELQALNDNLKTVASLGFSFEEFGSNSVIIREIPLVLASYNITDIFLDIAGKLAENRRNTASDIFENLLHSMACRAAIKAHDENSIEDLTELLRQVYANDEIRHCPHGRPVAVSMTKTEIEKRFGRV